MFEASSIKEQIAVDRPIFDVFEYVVDPRKFTEWIPFFSDVHVPPDFAFVAPNNVLGVKVGVGNLAVSDTITCTNLVPGRSATFENKRLPLTCSYALAPTAKGTLLTVTHVVRSPLLAPLLATSVAKIGTKQLLRLLKARLEAAAQNEPRKRIFFSYRRTEDKHAVGRVVDSLASEFGRSAIFMDIESIQIGPFGDKIRSALSRCEVVIAFIGPEWLRGFATPRETDWVFVELQESLSAAAQQKKVVVPVVVDGTLPIGEELGKFVMQIPQELRGLGDQQFRPLRAGPDFRQDMDLVLSSVWEGFRERGLPRMSP
jgi:hypothetical protein